MFRFYLNAVCCCVWYSIELTVVDRESGINSTQYQIIDRRNNDFVLVEGVVPAKRRFAEGTKRRKRVKA